MGRSLNDAEYILRRYNPSDSNHFVPDELGSGGRLTSGSFIFDADETGLEGCSNYQASVLNRESISHCKVSADTHPAVARVLVQEIRKVAEGGPATFDAIEDYWPPKGAGRSTGPAIDAAHVLVIWGTEIGGKARRRAKSALARAYELYL